MSKFQLTALALGLAIATGAAADPFYLDAGAYGTTNDSVTPYDSNTLTDSLDSLGWTDSTATSIYMGLTPGSAVIDTNDPTVLALYGIAPVNNPFGRLISDINPTDSLPDAENFTDNPSKWGDPAAIVDLGPPLSVTLLGGSEWGMTYTYTLNGVINAAGTGVDFTSGYFDLFFEDGTTSTQVLRLELGSFELVGGTSALYTVLASGNVTFDWSGDDGVSDASAFAQSFFVDAESGETFYDLWLNGGEINPLAVSWRMDNNIDCPTGQPNCTSVPLPGQLTPITVGDSLTDGYRRTTVDGTVRFFVPEPGSLALLGLGLAGLGMSLRRKQRA